MADLPQDWHAYAALQTQLAARTRCDRGEYAIEAGLDRLLDDHACTFDELTRTIATASRRNRYQTVLRATACQKEVLPDTVEALEARDALRGLHKAVTSTDWRLLHGVGLGHDFGTLSRREQVCEATLRVRVSRLRARMQHFSLAA